VIEVAASEAPRVEPARSDPITVRVLEPVEPLHLGRDALTRRAVPTSVEHLAVEVDDADATSVQLDRRFGIVTIAARLITSDSGQRRAVLHTAMMHLERGGWLLVAHHREQQVLCDGFRSDDLILLNSHRNGTSQLSLYQRGDRLTVHDLLYEARSTIKRYTPAELARQMQSNTPPLVLDTRTHVDRGRFGVIAGSVHVPRTVLEWHLDPANGYLHPAMHSFEQPLVVVCNGGYSSSLAAANLVRLGFSDVADLRGGHLAWRAAGLPVHQPDHSHLDLPVHDSAGEHPRPG
jgi:rhodanese-related sulfurtransferase